MWFARMIVFVFLYLIWMKDSNCMEQRAFVMNAGHKAEIKNKLCEEC